MKEAETKHLVIKGVVQGVGFRYSMCDFAESLGLTGWVRNCPDGSVEAMVQGSPEAVRSLIDWAEKGGPLAARVTAVEVTEGYGRYHNFAISHYEP